MTVGANSIRHFVRRRKPGGEFISNRAFNRDRLLDRVAFEHALLMRNEIRERAGRQIQSAAEPPIKAEQMDIRNGIPADHPFLAAKTSIRNAIDALGMLHTFAAR